MTHPMSAPALDELLIVATAREFCIKRDLRFDKYGDETISTMRYGIRSYLAAQRPAAPSDGSTNYVCDDDTFPTQVKFNNGRTVTIAEDDQEGPYLVISPLPTTQPSRLAALEAAELALRAARKWIAGPVRNNLPLLLGIIDDALARLGGGK